MWLREALHALEGWLVEVEFQVKCLSDGGVCDIIVSVERKLISACEVHGCARYQEDWFPGGREPRDGGDARWANATAGDDKIIARTHAAHCLNDIFLIIWNDLDSL